VEYSDAVHESPLPSFAVVVPAFNEEPGIEACVRAIESALGELPNRTQLIVVEDGSSDATADVLATLAGRHDGLDVESHERNRGYGAALRTGTLAAAARGYDYVVFMDSDLTNDPASLTAFEREMRRSVDVIKATRYSGGGGVNGVPWKRRIPSLLGNAVARRLFGLPLHDPTNGFRAVKTDLLAGTELHERGFAVIMEELYRLRPHAVSYAEVPVVLTTRAAHLRGTSFDYSPGAIWRYLRYPLLAARDRSLRSR
jgi:dolichol-phosphate mannosyltransferase